jgi:TFIIF-interacting CTD phosphatase-like protein
LCDFEKISQNHLTMTKQATTPIRNNYAAPNTPITSVKRPRSSIERSSSNASSTPSNQKSLVVTNTPNQNMSPMHPARPVESVAEDTTSWVGRKVDAIFSPVLSFLTSGPKDDAEESAIVTDEDLQMEGMAPLEDSPPSVYVSEDKVMEEEDASIAEEVASEVEEEEEEDEFNPYLFIKTLPRYETVCHLRPPVMLPPKEPNSPPLTLVLDLDETLVHCTVEPTSDSDETFPVVFHGVEYLVHVKLRPHVFEFLESVCDKFEVVVFTASQRVYADELLNRLDPSTYFCFSRE